MKTKKNRNTNSFKKATRKKAPKLVVSNEIIPEEERVRWEAVAGLSTTCKQLFNEVLNMKNIIRMAMEASIIPAALPALATTFTNDMTTQWNTLIALEQEHLNKFGPAQSDTEHMQIITLGASYDAWTANFHSTIIPIAADITALIEDGKLDAVVDDAIEQSAPPKLI